MKIFYDTEFIDDGRTIDLISIGMVAENGDEYYAVTVEFDKEKFVNSTWLMDNVLPGIPYKTTKVPGPATYSSDEEFGMRTILTPTLDNRHMVKPKRVIAHEVSQFIKEHSVAEEVELWSWYAAYDHVALAQLFGPMMDLPSWVPMFTMDLRQVINRMEKADGKSLVKLPKQTEGLHNALADAWHHFAIYNHLKKEYGIIE